MLNFFMLNVIMPSVTYKLFVPSVIMLSTVMLNVVMLSVMAPLLEWSSFNYSTQKEGSQPGAEITDSDKHSGLLQYRIN